MAALHEELIGMMPLVEEANSISAELDKQVKFEIVLVSPQIFGKDWVRSEVFIKMKHLENGSEYLWPKSKFLNRLYVMKDMYQRYAEGEEPWDLPSDQDPFQESTDTIVVIGTARIFLQSLSYLVSRHKYNFLQQTHILPIGRIERTAGDHRSERDAKRPVGSGNYSVRC
jgi:kinesin family member 1